MTEPLFPAGDGVVISSAIVSDCGTYRYELTRRWDTDAALLGWVMLNPSTADASTDDPTIRRCIGFARAWGYGGITVRNLYALRSTDPAALWNHHDPIGEGNDDHIAAVAHQCPLVMLAWGAHAPHARAEDVTALLLDAAGDADHRLAVLGRTKSGAPRHPLYIRADTAPQFYDGEAA